MGRVGVSMSDRNILQVIIIVCNFVVNLCVLYEDCFDIVNSLQRMVGSEYNCYHQYIYLISHFEPCTTISTYSLTTYITYQCTKMD